MTQDYCGLAKGCLANSETPCEHQKSILQPPCSIDEAKLFENVAICHQTIAYISRAEMLIQKAEKRARIANMPVQLIHYGTHSLCLMGKSFVGECASPYQAFLEQWVASFLSLCDLSQYLCDHYWVTNTNIKQALNIFKLIQSYLEFF